MSENIIKIIKEKLSKSKNIKIEIKCNTVLAENLINIKKHEITNLENTYESKINFTFNNQYSLHEPVIESQNLENVNNNKDLESTKKIKNTTKKKKIAKKKVKVERKKSIKYSNKKNNDKINQTNTDSENSDGILIDENSKMDIDNNEDNQIVNDEKKGWWS